MAINLDFGGKIQKPLNLNGTLAPVPKFEIHERNYAVTHGAWRIDSEAFRFSLFFWSLLTAHKMSINTIAVVPRDFVLSLSRRGCASDE